MKKLTALILTLVMLVSMTAIVPVSAEDLLVYPEADLTDVVPGSTFTISWHLNVEDLVFGVQGFAYYDPAVFTVVKNSVNEGFNDNTYAYGDDSIGHYYQAFVMNDGDGVEFSKGDMIWSFNVTLAEDVEPGEYSIRTRIASVDCDNKEYYTETSFMLDDVVVTVKGNEPEIDVDDKNITGNVYQVRVPYEGAEDTTFGFRFISEVDVTNYANYKEIGTLVIPADKLVGDLTVDNTVAEKVEAKAFMSEATDPVKQFNATMINIYDNNFNRNFTYRAYIVREDGTVVYGNTFTANILETIEEIYNAADNGLTAEQMAVLEAKFNFGA